MYNRTRTFRALCKTLVDTRSVTSREFHISKTNAKKEHPLLRTGRILGGDFLDFKEKFLGGSEDETRIANRTFPNHVDVLIIGGGAMGSSIAYWLKERTGPQGLTVAVVEKDQTYTKSSTVLSVGGLRQQFSLPENINMSLFGAEFIRTLKKRFGPDADVFFTPHGYLMLSSEEGAQQLMDNAQLQKQLGAVNKILGKEELARRFPWMNVSDVEVGCLGLEKEGWFDPWALLCLLKKGAVDKGAQYVTGEVTDFIFNERLDFEVEGVPSGSYEGIQGVTVKLPDGTTNNINFAYCILAAGAESGDIAKLAKIGLGEGMLSVPLPVERRKRYVYCFECQGDAPSINTPLTIDYSGAYFRRDGYGGSFIGGLSPPPSEEPETNNLDVDHKYFDEKVWPILAHRVPAFNSIKVKSAWGGYYDYNYYDENGIIGPHPYYHNMYIATGFSGHGIQQAPAVGRSVAEMILDGEFQTIDLSRFSFDRLMVNQPMLEANIV